MRIQHNITAMNSSRLLNIAEDKKTMSMERLSSGYRINRAADDAAGLAISEKMNSQIRGLNKASNNVDNGVLLVQTADGAIQEINDILIRMRTLSVQALNGTNTETDREILQDEVEQLLEEIDRIGKNTEFNTLPILQGEKAIIKEETGEITPAYNLVVVSEEDAFDDASVFDPQQNGILATIASSKTLDFSKVNSSNKNLLLDAGFKFGCSESCDQSFSFSFVKSVSTENKYGILDETPNANINSNGAENSKVFKVAIDSFNSGTELVDNLIQYVKEMNGDDGTADESNSNLYKVGHANYLFGDGGKLILGGTGDVSQPNSRTYEVFTSEKLADIVVASKTVNPDLIIQAGANEGQIILLDLPNIDAEALQMENIDISTYDGAFEAIGVIDKAMHYVNQERSRMGAYQNRLDHAINSLDGYAENLTGALSYIKDTDMAEEMATFTQYQVLTQAGNSMLAQANGRPQNILNLLQT